MKGLVKWAKGFYYRDGTGETQTVYLQHPDYTEEDSLNQLVDAELAADTDDASTVAITVGFTPTNGDEAVYDNVNKGDAIRTLDLDQSLQTYRTMALLVQETPNGDVQQGIEANSKVENDAARLKRWVENIAPGSLTGRTDSLSATDLGAGINFGVMATYQQTWSNNDADGIAGEDDYTDETDTTGHSPWYEIDDNRLAYRTFWTLAQADPDNATIIYLRARNGNPFTDGDGVPFFHSITIPAGATNLDDTPADDGSNSQYTNFALMKGDAVRVAVKQGSFAVGITVTIKMTTQT